VLGAREPLKARILFFRRLFEIFQRFSRRTIEALWDLYIQGNEQIPDIDPLLYASSLDAKGLSILTTWRDTQRHFLAIDCGNWNVCA
jgi:hypothetical protein